LGVDTVASIASADGAWQVKFLPTYTVAESWAVLPASIGNSSAIFFSLLSAASQVRGCGKIMPKRFSCYRVDRF
jgi:hypothetical protein